MKVVVFVAHPDDEIIGVGGTILKHIHLGDEVYIVIISEGKSSRADVYEGFDSKVIDDYISETNKALNILGVSDYKILRLPNNRLDRVDLLDIIKIIQKEIDKYKPDIIYTHYFGDLNIDHCIISRAVITAARALPGTTVKEILLFETLSSTEQAMALGKGFCPNLFVDISNYLEKKLLAMACYKSELREEPHPRSLSSIIKNSELWGSKVGLKAAEAFVVARIVR